MCGRFTLTKTAKEVEKRFEARFEGGNYKRTYNASPGNVLPVITGEQPDSLRHFRWGLVPGWAKDAAIGYKTINARVETIAEKPAFKFAFQRQRCLVPADSYYEWKASGKEKIPWRIMLKGGPLFAFAGLWEQWKNLENNETLHSFTIITRPAVHRVAHLHDRMPVILSRINEQLWLDTELPQEDLEKLLQPVNEKDLDFYTVSQRVNKTENDTPDLVKPHKYNVQGSLF